jgi:hypothetical protein
MPSPHNIEPAVVLLVGDFQDAFTVEAWKAIVEEVVNEAVRPASGSIAERRMRLKEQLLGCYETEPVFNCLTAFSENLVLPLPLPDGGVASSPHFLSALLRTLANYNVVAIISSGTATNTTHLFRHLGPLPIPVLVVVATVSDLLRIHPSERTNPTDRHATLRRSNALRLIPNNERQAVAIALQAMSLSLTHSVTLFDASAPDYYVTDLIRVLRDQFAEASQSSRMQLRVTNDSSELAKTDVGVFVGYLSQYDNVIAPLKQRPKHLVLSDGCYDPLRWTPTTDDIATNIWLAQPRHRVQTLAVDAYAAVLQVWRESLRHEQHPVDERLESATTLLRLALEGVEFGDRYSFSARENTSGGYRIDLVQERSK